MLLPPSLWHFVTFTPTCVYIYQVDVLLIRCTSPLMPIDTHIFIYVVHLHTSAKHTCLYIHTRALSLFFPVLLFYHRKRVLVVWTETSERTFKGVQSKTRGFDCKVYPRPLPPSPLPTPFSKLYAPALSFYFISLSFSLFFSFFFSFLRVVYKM